MSDENKDKGKSGQTKQPRDDKQRFLSKTQTDSTDQSSPTEGDYTRMNTILQKQTGMSAEKFVEYQRKLTPRELFNQLNFLAENQPAQPSDNKQGLPPNQPFVPITPGTDKFKLPGKAIGTQRMGKEDKFGLHIAFDPKELFTPKEKK